MQPGRKRVRFVGRACAAVVVFCGLGWVALTFGAFGNIGLPLGYYGQFNIARSAIEKSDCLASLQYGLHEDVTLESFRITVVTKSGWKASFLFTSRMSSRAACYSPKGLLAYNPAGRRWQVYSMEYLSAQMTQAVSQLRNVTDIVCGLDGVAGVLASHYDDEGIRSVEGVTEEFSEFLVLDSVPWRRLDGKAREGCGESASAMGETPQKGTAAGNLHTFEFEVITVDTQGSTVAKRMRAGRCYMEDLGGVKFEMVEIPGGHFLMGTTAAEGNEVRSEFVRYHPGRWDDAGRIVEEQYPQHPVSVGGFYMGKVEVTQSQWRAVAMLPKVNKDLISAPSYFKGDDLAVEQVSWEDAVEFCNRLSRATGREYRLPSEAEWEYACRAGTISQFHCGDTIPVRLTNFGSYYPFGSVKWGPYREETTPVGSLGMANGFGLYDMHGNVEEWCMDTWHENYQNAPSDGRAWESSGDSRWRVVRGGSWMDQAWYCRSAHRGRAASDGARLQTGFRIVASGPTR